VARASPQNATSTDKEIAMKGRSLVGARRALTALRIISVLRTTGTALLFVLLCNNAAFAAACFVYTPNGNSFESFDSPVGCGGLFDNLGINDRGQIVGGQGFVKDGTTFTTLNVPGADFTFLHDINNLGQIVGLHGPGGRAFLTDGTTFTSYDYPGATFTYAFGINDKSQIVGKYRVEVVVGPGPNTVQDLDHALVIDGALILQKTVVLTGGLDVDVCLRY
jgi:hypothetical protein